MAMHELKPRPEPGPKPEPEGGWTGCLPVFGVELLIRKFPNLFINNNKTVDKDTWELVIGYVSKMG
jgi:hypothetical protein